MDEPPSSGDLTRALSRRALLEQAGRLAVMLGGGSALVWLEGRLAASSAADAGATGGLGAKESSWPSPPDVDISRLLVHREEPQNLEAPIHELTSWITEHDLFYIRTHNETPRMDAASWRLQVEGLVSRSLTLSLADLQAFPTRTQVATLECAGNGRAFFEPKVEGDQWKKGAIGTARWRGVRLADVLDRAGVSANAAHVLLDGADTAGKAPDHARSIPLEKARDGTFLVFGMNAGPLSLAHGYPVRALVAGWTANHSVKWLTKIRVLDRPFEGPSMARDYRVPPHHVAPGARVDPATMEPVATLPLKSLIVTPPDGARLGPEPVTVSGVAYGGTVPIASVELSFDHGRAWTQAALEPVQARYAWRRWTYRWRPSVSGRQILVCRARDEQGRSQPILPSWNPGGYLWNVVDQVAVTVQRPESP